MTFGGLKKIILWLCTEDAAIYLPRPSPFNSIIFLHIWCFARFEVIYQEYPFIAPWRTNPLRIKLVTFYVPYLFGARARSSRSRMFFKIGVHKNLANFRGKHLPKSLQFYQKETPTKMFSCEFCDIFKNTFFYRTLPVAASEEH